MGALHTVGKNTGRMSDDDRTNNFDLVAGGSWWCDEEGMGILIFVASKKVLYLCFRGRNLAAQRSHITIG